MAKTNNVKHVMAFKVVPANKMGASIQRQVSMGKEYYTLLHVNACSVAVHLAHGNVEWINSFYAALQPRYQGAFRTWLGEITTFKDKDMDADRRWARYSTQDGFATSPNSDAARKAFIAKYKNGGKLRPFYERENNRDTAPFGLGEWFQMIESAVKRAKKKAVDEGLQVPADVLKELAALEKVAVKHHETIQ